ncbi:MAG: hypothetical protein KC620_24380, partial [Myxococcales bacterium]|nr:hypothetical protein [Myxococcales bacterium]
LREMLPDAFVDAPPPPLRDEGDADAARGLVARSALPAADRACLLRWIDRFPGRRWFRLTELALTRAEARQGVALPPGLRAVQATLAGVEPDRPWAVQFGGYSLAPTPPGLPGHWFQLGLLGARDPQGRRFIDRDGLFPIAEAFDPGRVVLMASLRGDARVFAIDPLDAAAGATAVFASVPDLIDHIVALRFGAGEVQRAGEGIGA